MDTVVVYTWLSMEAWIAGPTLNKADSTIPQVAHYSKQPSTSISNCFANCKLLGFKLAAKKLNEMGFL
jgi:hypothetical protein